MGGRVGNCGLGAASLASASLFSPAPPRQHTHTHTHTHTHKVRLEKETGQALYLGLSLSDTLRTALRLGHQREAAAIRKQFGVPEARWVCLLLRLGREWAGVGVLGWFEGGWVRLGGNRNPNAHARPQPTCHLHATPAHANAPDPHRPQVAVDQAEGSGRGQRLGGS